MDQQEKQSKSNYIKSLSLETFIFPIFFIGFFSIFAIQMGLANALNTMMNTAYQLLIDTVLYITAVCVIMGAISGLLSEFGFVSLADKVLQPFMKPIYGLPGAASLGIITTFLSDNPAILTLAEDHHFQSFFKKYQFFALTNLGTAFGMGLIVCTYMYSLSNLLGQPLAGAVLIGLLGALIGSIVSTRLMLGFTKKQFGIEEEMVTKQSYEHTIPENMRPIRTGGYGSRIMAAILEGGHSGVRMGISIIPGVLIICTFVMMLINGPSANGAYTGSAYEGIRLLPFLAEKADFIIRPLFGFESPEAIGVPVTALGAAGASLSITATLVRNHLVGVSDIAVFTAMCMCWSGYLSTHASMMDSLGCKNLIGKAILSHTIGGLVAGISAHWIYVLFTLF
ncbi:MAG: nucleoside recognition domain-containing protein [Solobacterium sp.]|nr:nucleoside recognition domain-containing protein [Solobacterium sp.]